MKIRTQSSGMMSPFEHVNCPPRSEFGLLAHMVGHFGVMVGLTVGLVPGPENELGSCWTNSSSSIPEPETYKKENM